ncbi:MAG: hypothetical protein HC909_02810 [Blastochloris sp.]|nr:hypothetical protein [Blastochloris sp.]
MLGRQPGQIEFLHHHVAAPRGDLDGKAAPRQDAVKRLAGDARLLPGTVAAAWRARPAGLDLGRYGCGERAMPPRSAYSTTNSSRPTRR